MFMVLSPEYTNPSSRVIRLADLLARITRLLEHENKHRHGYHSSEESNQIILHFELLLSLARTESHRYYFRISLILFCCAGYLLPMNMITKDRSA